MKLRCKMALIFCILTFGALPAWANNPPQPDGLFSIIVIIPVAIIGYRLAGVAYTESQRKWRVLRGLLLGLAVIIAMAGTEIAIIPLAVFLVLGCVRGVQIIVRGQGFKRVLIGTTVCLWTLFAVSDYCVSLLIYSHVPVDEMIAVDQLRGFAKTEETYARTHDSKYATIEQLRDAHTPLQLTWGEPSDNPGVYDLYLNGNIRSGYRFSSTVGAGNSRFLIAAVPAEYEKNILPLFIPGSSLLHALRGHPERQDTGQRSFAIDETGVIRAADLGTTRPVTRDEVEKWKPLQ